jgi:AraC-like DNA-binding protein
LAEALAAASRQYTIWLCSRIVKDGSPTEIARRFWQITGTEIPRWTVAKQLAKVRRVLHEKEMI